MLNIANIGAEDFTFDTRIGSYMNVSMPYRDTRIAYKLMSEISVRLNHIIYFDK